MKKKLQNKMKKSHLDSIDAMAQSPLTDTSYNQQSLKQTTCFLPQEAVKESESKPKYYIPKTQCPTIGCNGVGHINGKFTSHYR